MKKHVIISIILLVVFISSCDDRPFFGGDYIPDENNISEGIEKIESDVYIAGQDNHIYFRIPALIETKSGKLLSFCEARNTEADFYKGNESLFPTTPVGSSSKDTGDIDLVVKASTDGGKTWEKMSIIADDKNNTCGNPCPIVADDGTIHLFWCWQQFPSTIDSEIFPTLPKDGHKRRVMYTRSTDEGLSWSSPRDMTIELKDMTWTWYATGPCHGIQIKTGKYKGRLLVPCNHRDAQDNINYSHCVYSDDNGETWKLGGSTEAGGNESCIVELSNGTVMTNVRSIGLNSQNRAQSISTDGGINWGPLIINNDLLDPGCQGSIINLYKDGNPSNILILSNNHYQNRSKMSISVSKDDGDTWSVAAVVWGKRSAYSDLCLMNDGSLALLYECGDGAFGTPNPNERIRFLRIPSPYVNKFLGL